MLGSPKSLWRHNGAGNGRRDGGKSQRIGQSAAKLLSRKVEKVQRLGHTAYGLCYGDEARRVERISIVLVHPKRPAPTR
ncbi:hypothetical protein I656_03567 [Geobacillus sp. WSUCF1]|nr:hypothetical protein I656_03567 [Geobacillus sp. WSUCF1]